MSEVVIYTVEPGRTYRLALKLTLFQVFGHRNNLLAQVQQVRNRVGNTVGMGWRRALHARDLDERLAVPQNGAARLHSVNHDLTHHPLAVAKNLE